MADISILISLTAGQMEQTDQTDQTWDYPILRCPRPTAAKFEGI